MTYSCEIIGFENIQILERIHSEFLSRITKTKKSTMFYAELGCYPVEIIVKSRIVSFWNRMLTNKVSSIKQSDIQFPINQWLSFIKNIVSDVGRYDLWLNQNNIQIYEHRKISKTDPYRPKLSNMAFKFTEFDKRKEPL